MFAIVSGLGHRAVSRLRQSWDKLPGKYQRVFNELQQLMDPSRNMSKYRQLISAEQTQPPIVSNIFIYSIFMSVAKFSHECSCAYNLINYLDILINNKFIAFLYKNKIPKSTFCTMEEFWLRHYHIN